MAATRGQPAELDNGRAGGLAEALLAALSRRELRGCDPLWEVKFAAAAAAAAGGGAPRSARLKRSPRAAGTPLAASPGLPDRSPAAPRSADPTPLSSRAI